MRVRGRTSVFLSVAKDLCWSGARLSPTPFLSQVIPPWIHRRDQRHLPRPRPSFELLFSSDRVNRPGGGFNVDQSVQPILANESAALAGLMLLQALREVACYADVKRLATIGENVDREDSWHGLNSGGDAASLRVNRVLGKFGKRETMSPARRHHRSFATLRMTGALPDACIGPSLRSG